MKHALIPNATNKVIFATFGIILLFILTYPLYSEDLVKLPGRLGTTTCYVVRIGKADVYFYMTPEKDQVSRQLVTDIGEEMILLDKADLPLSTEDLLHQANRDATKTSREVNILNEYTKNVQNTVEEYFDIQISAISRDVNTYCSWEGLEYHQDRLVQQYDYINRHPLPIPKYTLIQDLTLIDWQMTPDAMSATIVQDGELGDRFLFCQFPGEVVGTIYAEPADYPGPYIHPSYPGHITLPYHSGIPPIAFNSVLTTGPFKGKRASTVVRGIVETSQMDRARSLSTELFLNRSSRQSDADFATIEYENGITLKHLPENMPSLEPTWNYKQKDQQNVDIIEIPITPHIEIIQALTVLFNLNNTPLSHVKIIRITKRDGGFSHFNLMNLNIPKNSHIILINRSELPEYYRYFNIAQDFTKKGLPWIQLYQLNPMFAAKIPFEEFNQMSLTPIEELFFANEHPPAHPNMLRKKIVSKIDLFIFEPREQ